MKRIALLPFQLDQPPAWYATAGYVAALIGVGLATGVLWIAQPILSLGSVYLVYLVVVLAIAVGWGWKQSFLAAVLAFLAANYFFIPPIFTFTIANPQDLLALIIFLGLATLASQLVSAFRNEAQEARRGQQITSTLYVLSQTINRQRNLKKLLDEVCRQLSEVLHLDACTIAIRDPERTTAVTSYSGQLLKERDHGPNMVHVDLEIGKRRVGELRLRYPDGRQRATGEAQLMAAFAEQLQIAIERDRLQQAEIDSEVLRRTDALRAALLSAVAHDLRTPLSSIKVAATSLLAPPVQWSEEDRNAFLKTIVGEVDRINRLAGNLLDMSRIEAGKLNPHKEPHYIGDVIETVLERLAPILKGHPIDTNIAPDLPAVSMDEVEIDEVLTNLLENANKYTPPGTAIHVLANFDKDNIKVQVADDGPGIPPEHIPYLFDRFYRVTAGAAGAGGAKGTGLGLAIVKGIVEAHDGTVTAANRKEGGVVFSFTLPLHKASQAH